jgi:hypothetical protein
MTSRAARITGVIEMERTPTRVEPFFDEHDDLDSVGELARMARGFPGESCSLDADEIVYADVEQLSEDLDAEYAAVRRLIASARH